MGGVGWFEELSEDGVGGYAVVVVPKGLWEGDVDFLQPAVGDVGYGLEEAGWECWGEGFRVAFQPAEWAGDDQLVEVVCVSWGCCDDDFALVCVVVGLSGWCVDVHDWLVELDLGVCLRCLGNICQYVFVGRCHEVVILSVS